MSRANPQDPSFSGVFSRTFLVAVLVILAIGYLGRAFVERSLLVPDADARPVTPRGNLASQEETIISLFEAAAPTVVHIQTSRIQERSGFFRVREVEVPEGSGSGYLWDDDGHVVTNFHVIRNADTADVTLNDGTVHTARLVGTAPDSDLAVLRISAMPNQLRPIPIGSSSDLRVGQTVLAIGNPYGLEQTLTTGVISGLNRSIQSVTGVQILGVIQTDAAINPGNSGGPLLDSAGRLIGINTAIQSPTGAYAGIGFAVPVDTINRIVPRILREGFAPQVGLGIRLGEDDWARDNGFEGAVVHSVVPGSGAERAGMRPVRPLGPGRYSLGDTIIAVDGKTIRGREDLLEVLQDYSAGDVVTVRVRRPTEGEDRLEDLQVQLQELR